MRRWRRLFVARPTMTASLFRLAVVFWRRNTLIYRQLGCRPSRNLFGDDEHYLHSLQSKTHVCVGRTEGPSFVNKMLANGGSTYLCYRCGGQRYPSGAPRKMLPAATASSACGNPGEKAISASCSPGQSPFKSHEAEGGRGKPIAFSWSG